MTRRRPPQPPLSLAPIAMTALIASIAIGCGDQSTRPDHDAPEQPSPDDPAARTLGLVQVTLTGITAPSEMTATARNVALGRQSDTAAVPSDASLDASRDASRDAPEPASADASMRGSEPASFDAASPDGLTPQSLDPVEEGERSGIQLEPVATGSFTYGERGAGGQRYLSATFRVRNADADGEAYTDAVGNVTMVAVATDETIGETPVSRLERFDGDDAPASLAAGLHPTGAASLGPSGEPTASTADALQVFTEAEAADLAAAAGLDNVFPYGFVVRNPDRWSSRELPGDPEEGRFDGLINFGFRVPLADDPADDPYEVSVMMLAVSDTETRLTQSFEEQTVCPDALETRANTLQATTVTLLDGGEIYEDLPTREIAEVRTAGTAASPAASLPDAVTDGYPAPPEVLDLTSVSTTVVPIAWSVEPTPDPNDEPTVMRAVFGYYNPAAMTEIPFGPSNFFNPPPAFKSQPATFEPGLHIPPDPAAFEIEFDTDTLTALQWNLDGRSATADTDTRPPACEIRH